MAGVYYATYNRDTTKDKLDTKYVSNLSDGTNTYVIKDSNAIHSEDVTSIYSPTGTDPINGTAVKSAIDGAISSVYKAAGSVAFANLPALGSTYEGYVYNITDAFTTTADFVEGAGKSYPAGTNVVCINTSSLFAWYLSSKSRTLYTLTATPSVGDVIYDNTGTATNISVLSVAGDYSYIEDDKWSGHNLRDASKDITDYKWDVLAGFVDLSNYQTLIDSSNKLNADYITDGTTNKVVTAAEKTTWSGKQDQLVSGTNIKTINGTSILGSGNISTSELPSQSGNSGKFLTTNGTTASWETISIPVVDQTYSSSSTSTNALSHKAIADARFIQNNTEYSGAIAILGTFLGSSTSKGIAIGLSASAGETNVSSNGPIAIGFSSTSQIESVAIGGMSYATSGDVGIGYNSQAKGTSSVAIGDASGTSSEKGIAIGSSAKVNTNSKYGIAIGSHTNSSAYGAIQLGGYNLTNSEAGTLYVGLISSGNTATNYKLLGSDGKVPDARLNNPIPSQSGNSGKFLTTDGTSISWATVQQFSITYDSTNKRLTF